MPLEIADTHHNETAPHTYRAHVKRLPEMIPRGFAITPVCQPLKLLISAH